MSAIFFGIRVRIGLILVCWSADNVRAVVSCGQLGIRCHHAATAAAARCSAAALRHHRRRA